MSQENVDRFLEGAEAFSRGDVEGALRGFDADVVFEPQVSVLAVVASFRDGLCTRWKDYGDKDQALEALGLTE